MLRNLLDIKSLNIEQLAFLLRNALSFIEVSKRELKKVPALRGKTVINLFLEPSTRTRTSFEIAGKRLSSDVINVSGSSSSVTKGETLLDTAATLAQMAPDIIVLRHSESGSCHFLSELLPNSAIINAGDGMNEHPTQALLDALTLLEYFAAKRGVKLEPQLNLEDFLAPLRGLKVTIVGDVRHSRVARSNIFLHQLLESEITLCGPATLVPEQLTGARFANANSEAPPLKLAYNLADGLEGADVVICLRMQLERQSENFVPSLSEYSRHYCVSERLLSRYAPNSVVLHPGPMNRGVELSSEVADGPRSLVKTQVAHGVAVRMAVLFALATGDRTSMESGSSWGDTQQSDAPG